MRKTKRLSLALACAMTCTAASAVQFDGKLPMYPRGRNMNEMPAAAVSMGVPLVLETDDSVQTVDAWYASNAPKSCARTAQSGGVKYQCPSGSIVIYAKDKTQIAFLPSFPQ
ncbi:MAG TPA: hypothetical protein VGI20_05475 [Rhizomicrobium sp.]|jgi:hypothetical protein